LINSPEENYQTSLSLEKSFPTDEALQAKARKILGVEHTSPEDLELLEKFQSDAQRFIYDSSRR
jgi:hypothetical protein